MPFRVKDLIISVVPPPAVVSVEGDCGGQQSCSGSSECTAVSAVAQSNGCQLIDPADLAELGPLLEQALMVYRSAAQPSPLAPRTAAQITSLRQQLTGAIAELDGELHQAEQRHR